MSSTNKELTARNAIVNSKSQFSKAAHLMRETSVVKLGNDVFRMPEYIKKNSVAVSHFKRVVKLYKEFDFGSSADVHLIARYAMTQSDYEGHLVQKATYENQILSLDAQVKKLETKRLQSSRDRDEIRAQFKFKAELIKSLNAIDILISRKNSELIKLEDKLFLSPLSRAREILPGVAKKNAAKGSADKEENPFIEAFGGL